MKITVKSMCRISIVAALYFVITMVCKPFVFGPVEFRLSEMLNFLMFIDPIYIIGITLGCALSNFFTFGVMDVFIGSASTFLVGVLMWKSKRMWTGIVYATLGTSAIAWELWFFFGLPFWYQFAVGAFGEFVSMVLGYIVAVKLFKNEGLLNIFRCTPGNNKEVKY